MWEYQAPERGKYIAAFFWNIDERIVERRLQEAGALRLASRASEATRELTASPRIVDGGTDTDMSKGWGIIGLVVAGLYWRASTEWVPMRRS